MFQRGLDPLPGGALHRISNNILDLLPRTSKGHSSLGNNAIVNSCLPALPQAENSSGKLKRDHLTIKH
jgi:hypothetical protein